MGGPGVPELLSLGFPVLGGTAGGPPPPLVVLLLPLPRDSLSFSLNSTSGGGGGRSTSASSGISPVGGGGGISCREVDSSRDGGRSSKSPKTSWSVDAGRGKTP